MTDNKLTRRMIMQIFLMFLLASLFGLILIHYTEAYSEISPNLNYEELFFHTITFCCCILFMYSLFLRTIDGIFHTTDYDGEYEEEIEEEEKDGK